MVSELGSMREAEDVGTVVNRIMTNVRRAATFVVCSAAFLKLLLPSSVLTPLHPPLHACYCTGAFLYHPFLYEHYITGDFTQILGKHTKFYWSRGGFEVITLRLVCMLYVVFVNQGVGFHCWNHHAGLFICSTIVEGVGKQRSEWLQCWVWTCDPPCVIIGSHVCCTVVSGAFRWWRWCSEYYTHIRSIWFLFGYFTVSPFIPCVSRASVWLDVNTYRNSSYW